MTRTTRDFAARSSEERELGAPQHLEYEENGHVYVEDNAADVKARSVQRS
jgi:hypothetical protein